MKVLQILPELNLGGVERGTIDLARELKRRNYQAFIISNGGVLVKELESCGARHIKLPVHKKSLFPILFNITKVAKVLQDERIDIVHARSRVPALIAFLACRRTGTTFVTTCHGYYSQNFFSRVMGWGKYVIVSSNAIAQHMIEDFGVPIERVRLIPRGVDLREFVFQKKPKGFTIGVVSRLTPIKGHKYFLQALAKVIRVVPQARALIVGEISPGKEKYKEELMVLTRRLSIDKFVEFIGQENNLPKLLARLNILVLPTVVPEAFGRVLIEAGACGVPVIATRVGGVVDIIQDGVNGILVTPGDAADLASAIIKLCNEPQLSQRLTLAARKNVEENFTLQQMVKKTIQVYEEAQRTLKILAIKLSALGDIILAIPSLRALHENFPTAYITVLVSSDYRSVLQNCPYIHQILEIYPDGRKHTPYPFLFSIFANLIKKDIFQVSSLLRKLNFDIVVDLQNNRKSHLLAYLSGCNRRYGYKNGKFSFLLNRTVREIKTPISPIEHQSRSLKLLGIESIKGDLELWPDENDKNWAEDFLKAQRKDQTTPLIGINLGASPKWPSKRWQIEKFVAIIDKMQNAGFEVVITGKGPDRQLMNELKQLTNNHFIDALDMTSIMQLACLIKRCNVYITSDSAPLHIAYAMKTPVVALFGPTDPRRHALFSTKQIIVKKDIDCSPCYKGRCRKHSCMEKISAEEVFEAVKWLLEKK
jgi:lipopolysaccharide heptosyltransferase II